YHIGGGSVVAKHERLLPHDVEQWLAFPDLVMRTCGDDEKLCSGGSFRPAEDWSSDVVLPALVVRGSKPPGKSDADRAARDVDFARAKRLQDSLLTKDGGFQRDIVGEHRNDSIRGGGRLSGSLSDAGSARGERFGSALGPVEDDQLMSGLEQLARHRRSHRPKA